MTRAHDGCDARLPTLTHDRSPDMALIDDPPAVEGPDLGVSRRLLADGIAAMDRGSLSEAVRLLHGALAALGLHVNPAPARPVLAPASPSPVRTALAARILLSLAFAHHELGSGAAALQAFDNAEALAAEGSTPRSGC